MNDYIAQSIYRMHEKFGIDYQGPPRELPKAEKYFRIQCMEEEIIEYTQANSMVGELDALIDLIIFAAGTLHRHGYPLKKAFDIVMKFNHQKELAGDASASKRNFEIDLIKPDNWQGPESELEALLNDH